MTSEVSETPKTKPKAKKASPPKKIAAKKPTRKTIPIDGELHARIAALSDKSGLPVIKLVHHMLNNVLNVVENGGKISVDLETGDIQFAKGAAGMAVVPKANIGAANIAPERGPNETRHVDLSGLTSMGPQDSSFYDD